MKRRKERHPERPEYAQQLEQFNQEKKNLKRAYKTGKLSTSEVLSALAKWKKGDMINHGNHSKHGGSYRITVSSGYDLSGKQIRHTMTWTPPDGMTEKQIQKEVNRQAVLFEGKVRTGQVLNGNIKFADFAEP